jgi:hypothetical protein
MDPLKYWPPEIEIFAYRTSLAMRRKIFVSSCGTSRVIGRLATASDEVVLSAHAQPSSTAHQIHFTPVVRIHCILVYLFPLEKKEGITASKFREVELLYLLLH